MRRKLLPVGHSSILVVINNLGGLRLRVGDWAGAASLYEQVVRARRERPAGGLALATPLSNLSVAWVRMGRLEDAIAASREAAALMQSAVGARSVGVTYPMETTASALTRLERYDEAEQVHREIVDIRRDAYGEEGHPNVVFSVEGLAWFCSTAIGRRMPCYSQTKPLQRAGGCSPSRTAIWPRHSLRPAARAQNWCGTWMRFRCCAKRLG
jgi:tetratricopeptide (TPR) repeat protein